MALPDNPRLVYLDSCCFLAVINGEEGAGHVKQVLRLADEGKLDVAISALHYVEVRGNGLGKSYDETVDQRAMEHLDNRLRNYVEFNRGTGVHARGLAVRHQLKNYDSIHLACAINAGADVLMSPDKGFKKLWGTQVEGVWIAEPYPIGEEPLPGM